MAVRVMVTGATGFVGPFLLKLLVQAGFDTSALVRRESDVQRISNLPAKLVYGDVLELPLLIQAFNGLDYVIHLAAVNSPAPQDAERMAHTNVEGTANVARACLAAKVRRLIHFSSVCTIGVSFDGGNCRNEEHPFNLPKHRFAYIDSKVESENIILRYVRESNLDAVILNPSMMIGPGDARIKTRDFQRKVVKGRLPFSPPGGTNVVSVHDVVSAAFESLTKARKGERYILGGGNVLFRGLLALFAKEAGVRGPLCVVPKIALQLVGHAVRLMSNAGIPVPFPAEHALLTTYYHWYDSSKAQKELGFQQRPLTDAVRESVSFMRADGMA